MNNDIQKTEVQPIRKAVMILHQMSEDEKIQEMARLREKALHDEATALSAAIKKGRAEGLAEGIDKGRAEGLAEGMSKGIDKGRAEGLAEGINKGRAEERESIIERIRQDGVPEEQIRKYFPDE